MTVRTRSAATVTPVLTGTVGAVAAQQLAVGSIYLTGDAATSGANAAAAAASAVLAASYVAATVAARDAAQGSQTAAASSATASAGSATASANSATASANSAAAAATSATNAGSAASTAAATAAASAASSTSASLIAATAANASAAAASAAAAAQSAADAAIVADFDSSIFAQRSNPNTFTAENIFDNYLRITQRGSGQNAIDFLTKSTSAADVLGSAGTKGYTLAARGDQYFVPAERNDLILAYYSGSGWSYPWRMHSLTGQTSFASRPEWGATPWDSANFDPTTKVNTSTYSADQATLVTSLASKVNTSTYSADQAANTTALGSKANLSGATFTGPVLIRPVAGSGTLEIGPAGEGSALIDFHSGATLVDYDSRIIASGGTGSIGGGNIEYIAANHTFTGNVAGITKAEVGLSNVDNTSDANKPVSTAQAVAIAAKASIRNRINNGAFVVDQQGLGATTTPGYFVDGWGSYFNAAGATCTYARVNVTTPEGNAFRARFTVGTGKTLATGEYLMFYTRIEGVEWFDQRYGFSNAKSSVVRFGFKGPAGTYSVAFRNLPTSTRAYVASFTISAGQANTDTVQSFVIPGDTTGTWATDNQAGIELMITMGVHSALQAAGGAWIASTAAFGATGTRATITSGEVFEVFDAGWYSGSALPIYEVPSYADELRTAKRYLQKVYYPHYVGVISSTSGAWRVGGPLEVEMRANPTILSFNLAIQGVTGTGNISAINANYSSTSQVEFDCTFSTITGAAAGQVATTFYDGGGRQIILSARL